MATAASQSFSLTAGHRRLGAKLVGAVLSLAFVLVFNFFLFRVPPGDPAKNLTRNRLVPAEQVQVLCESFGLGKPLHEQFISYVGDTLRGDLGISYKFRRPSRRSSPSGSGRRCCCWASRPCCRRSSGCGSAAKGRGSGGACSTGSRWGRRWALYAMPE